MRSTSTPRTSGALFVTLLSAVLLVAPSSAQPCTVVHVRGEVRPSTGATASPSRDSIFVGASVAPTDTFDYGTHDARVVALCPQHGRIVYRPQQELGGWGWTGVATTVILDPYTTRHLGTRGASAPDTLRTLPQLRRHFNVDAYLVLGAYAVPVEDHLRARLESGSRVVLSSVNDSRNAELPFKNGHLIVQPSLLYRIGTSTEEIQTRDRVRPGPVVLHWISGSDRHFLAVVKPALPSAAQVEREIHTLATVLKKQGVDSGEIRRQIHDFLQETYGTAYRPHAENWIEERMRMRRMSTN